MAGIYREFPGIYSKNNCPIVCRLNLCTILRIWGDLMTEVSVIMGSDSDLETMSKCLKALEEFQLSFEVFISSAHRLPEETAAIARSAASKGIKVIIAGAGGAAHLAGVIAALTPLPVIAVPLSNSSLGGIDALYATVQMPKGIPVATVAVDGAFNAGVLAAQIIGIHDPLLREKVISYKKELAAGVKAKNDRLQKIGYREFLEEKRKRSYAASKVCRNIP